MGSLQLEEGLPAQLHLESLPDASQREDSDWQYHGEAAVDIVLVHGLGSKYATTWTHKRKDGTRYRWIQGSFAKDIPDARILGFEYPSRWYSDPIHTDLTECAWQLVQSLIEDRCNGHAKMDRNVRARPIILIGHSFGGLVIKKAMIMAGERMRSNSSPAEYENHRDLLCAIAGVIFLGTPHRGTSYTLLARAKMWYGDEVVRIRSNDTLVNVLMPDSYTLTDLQRQFSQLYGDKRMSGLQLSCHYEMREVSVLLGSGLLGMFNQERFRLVVPAESAVLDGWPAHGVNASHMEMNTFCEGDDDKRDPNYSLLLSDVTAMMQRGREVIPGRFNRWTYGSISANDEREQIQRWLGTSESRQAQQTAFLKNLKIQQSAPYTCQWIHETMQFRSWLSDLSDVNTLWITGTAGSGKSVLTSYIIQYLSSSAWDDREGHTHYEAGHPNQPCVLHFFCGIDRLMETPTKMLSVLIHQLLAARPEDDELFDLVQRVHRSSISSGASAETLASALGAMRGKIGGDVYIVIDNLEDIEDPVAVLKALAPLRERRGFRFIFSSQDVAQIARVLRDDFDVTRPLLITDHTATDVESFVQLKTDAILQAKPSLRQQRDVVIQTLTHGARGMFQWVNSALHHLADVEDPRDVQSVLEDVSDDLLCTYDKTFDRLASKPGPTTVSRVRTCLKIMAVATRPLTCADVKMAFLVQDALVKGENVEEELASLFERSDSKERSQLAEREVLSYLETLVSVLPDGTIQFRHPTILRALGRLRQDRDGPGLRGRSHSKADTIKFNSQDAHLATARICMAICRVTTFTHANAFDEWQAPLVQYAWCYWAHHLMKSEFNFRSVSELAQAKANSPLADSAKMSGAGSTQILFDDMLESVSRDALIYLESLVSFLAQPLKAVPGVFSDRDYVLSLLMAQESLILPSRELCSLRQSLFDRLSSALNSARQEVSAESKRKVPELSRQALMKKRADDTFHYAKAKLLGLESVVRRLRVDSYLQRKPEITRPRGAQKQMFEIARALRVAALRFAIDPIYSALLTEAGGSSFSPLHPLVYVAQLLEEAALYPYWEALPPGTDPLSPFICQSNDREYDAAKFVLHCFEWRDPRQSEENASESQQAVLPLNHVVGKYNLQHLSWAPARGLEDGRPCPSFQALKRVTTENWEQVQRLREPSAEHWYSALVQYGFFRAEHTDTFGKMIVNPITNMHMKTQLMMSGPSDGSLFDNTEEVLLRHAPREVRETPLKSYVRSLPSILRLLFYRYVLDMMRIFGQLARTTFYWHFVKIDMATSDLEKVKFFLRRIVFPDETPDMPRVPLVHFIPGTILFLLRCRYFPAWGSFIWFHSWSEFPYAYRHAAAYLDLQAEFGFWDFCKNMSMYLADSFIGTIVLIWTMTPEHAASPAGTVGFPIAIFHLLCAVDRSLFSLASIVATVLASSRILLYDADNVARLFQWSLWNWVVIFFQLSIAGVQLAITEYTNGSTSTARNIMMALGFPLLQIGTLWFFSWHFIAISGWLFSLTRPARFLVMFIWRNFMFASVFAAKAFGTLLIFIAVFKAFASLRTFTRDPYDTEGNRQKLLQVSGQIRGTQNIPHAALKQIGRYPLGIDNALTAQQSEDREPPNETGPAPQLKAGESEASKPLTPLRFGATQAKTDDWEIEVLSKGFTQ